MTKNWKKLQLKIFFYFFWSKTAIYLSLGLHKVCPSYRRCLQLSKEAIQHFKTWTFINFCLLLWVIYALLDPGPDSGSGSTDPIRSGSGSATLLRAQEVKAKELRGTQGPRGNGRRESSTTCDAWDHDVRSTWGGAGWRGRSRPPPPPGWRPGWTGSSPAPPAPGSLNKEKMKL